MITVFNKIDLLPDPAIAEKLVARNPGSVAISAETGENIDALLRRLAEVLSSRREVVEFSIPQDRGDVAALVSERGHVIETRYEDGAIIMVAELEKPLASKLREFVREQR
jgi:GTP-binding protein HflX